MPHPLLAWLESSDGTPISAAVRAEFYREQADRTLVAGRWLSGLVLLLMPLVMLLDQRLPGMVAVWPWRLMAIFWALVFMVYSLVRSWHRPRLTIGLHCAVMMVLMWCMCGLNIEVLCSADVSPGVSRAGVQGALLLGVFGSFAFASGARVCLPLVFGFSIPPMFAWFLVVGNLTGEEWSLFMDPTIVSVAAMVMARSIEKQVRREFVVRHMAVTSRAELELRLDELKEANRRLQAEAAERGRLEADLRRHAQELVTANVLLERETEEHRVTAARVNTYAQTLRQSNEMLEQFTYVASHDLKEPLRTVSSFLGLVARRLKTVQPRDARTDEYISVAIAGALRMDKLIDALLSYSRLSSRSEPFTMVDLNDVVTEATGNLKAALADSGGAILSSVLPSSVLGDRSQLVTLFQNLFSNALRYRSKDEAPRIQVSGDMEGDLAHVLVRDNGIGIAPQYHERIFQVFQRLHSRAEYEGTGIGLAVVRRIVERHGGRVWVESELGKGSTFHLTLGRGSPG